jgi:hypothetical protein
MLDIPHARFRMEVVMFLWLPVSANESQRALFLPICCLVGLIAGARPMYNNGFFDAFASFAGA